MLTPQQLCAGATDGGYANPRCVRNAIEALAPLFAEKLAIAAFIQPACLLLFVESGLAGWASRALHGRADGRFRAVLDMEFASTLAHIELALFYGLVLPIVLPMAALSMASHRFVFDFLLRHRGAGTLSCASPPVRYLQVSLLLQAGLATWFFAAVEGADVGAAVGVLTFLGAACWLRGARRSRPAQTVLEENVALVSSERGLWVTLIDDSTDSK